MTVENFKALLSSGADMATIISNLKNSILELTPNDIKLIKEDFITSGEFKSDLEYSKKAVLSHYSNKLASILDTYLSNQKNKDIKKSLKGLFKPLNDILNCRNWLIDLRFHSFDSLADKESLIKFCDKLVNGKNGDFFVIDEVSFETVSGVVNYNSSRLFSTTKIKELNGSNNDDGGTVYSASSLLQFLKNEVDANRELNIKKINNYKESLVSAKETLADKIG